MKKSVLCVFLCMIGVAAQAVLIDDLNDASLIEYTLSRINDSNGTAHVSFSSPSGDLRASYVGTPDAYEQVLFLRDDYSLGIGEMLMADVTNDGAGWDRDLGIAVCYSATPPALASGASGDVRTSYVEVSFRSNGQVMSYARNGTTNLTSGQEFAGTTYNGESFTGYPDSIFIERLSQTEFQVGWVEGQVKHILTNNGTSFAPYVITINPPGAAVGFYADVRAAIALSPTGLDNLRIWSPLYQAHDPNPADNAEMVGTPIGTTGFVEVTLGWKAGIDPDGAYEVNPAIKKHYVFLSKDQTVYTEDPNLYYVAAVDQTSLTDPNAEYVADPPLRSGGLYLWMVEEGLDNGLGGVYGPGDPNNLSGPEWTFETVSTIPVILTQPVLATVILGTTADPAFTINVFSTTTAHYQWYYSADEVIGSDTSIGSDQPSLAIVNAQMSDQGYYYCRVWNDATVSGGGSAPDLTSSVVPLSIGRLVAEYKFENNLTDTSGEGNNGNEADPNKPTFDNTDPLDGYHAVFNGTNQYADFGIAAYPKAGPLAGGIGGGLNEGTVTCWVKASQVGGLLSNYNDGTTTGFALSLATNSPTADTRMNARGEAADVGTVQGRPGMTGYDVLTDGQWHMMTAAWKAGDTMTVYVDGGPVASVAAGTPAAYAAWQRGVLFGATRNATDRGILQTFYGGRVDNLRVYNYRRTPDQIANDYYTVTGDPACTEPGFEGSAYNYDNTISSYCRIDLADLAVFIRSWLADGLSTGQ